MCLQSVEGSGQTSSIAEGINEGDEGEGEPDATSADTELLVSPSRRLTEDSAVSSMLGRFCCMSFPGCYFDLTGQHLLESLVGTLRLSRLCMACAGEDEGEEEMSRRANGLRSRNSRTLSESGGSRDLEDDAQEAMQEMLGAQEWHQVRLLGTVY